jgi:hypothetical protein
MFSPIPRRLGNLVRFLSRGYRDQPGKKRVRLGLEVLEDRTLLSTVTWINSAGGDWDTAANWKDDQGNNGVPGAADDVVIPPGSYTVTHASAVTDAATSITNQAAITLSDGTLNVSGNVTGTGQFTLAGGTLANATVMAGTTITGTHSRGTLSALTLNGRLDLIAQDGASATISSALRLNGTIRLGDAQFSNSGSLYLDAGVTVSGNGDILLGRSDFNAVSGLSATLGPNVTIHGASGRIHSLINQGTIIADVPYKTALSENPLTHATSRTTRRHSLPIFGGTFANAASA